MTLAVRGTSTFQTQNRTIDHGLNRHHMAAMANNRPAESASDTDD